MKCSVHIHVRVSIITNLCHVFCKGNPNHVFSWQLGSSCVQFYWLYNSFTIWKWICIYYVQKLFKPWRTSVNVALRGPLAWGHHERTCPAPLMAASQKRVWPFAAGNRLGNMPEHEHNRCAQDSWTGDWQVLNKRWWFQFINSQLFTFHYKFQVKT